MKRSRGRSGMRSLSEINMTPLIDLTFLLLITFVITFPLIEQGVHVRLPTGRSDPLDPAGAMTVTVDVEGRIFLDREPIGLDELEARLSEGLQGNPAMAVLVRGDERIAYGRIVEVIRVLRRARVSRLALVTQAE